MPKVFILLVVLFLVLVFSHADDSSREADIESQDGSQEVQAESAENEQFNALTLPAQDHNLARDFYWHSHESHEGPHEYGRYYHHHGHHHHGHHHQHGHHDHHHEHIPSFLISASKNAARELNAILRDKTLSQVAFETALKDWGKAQGTEIEAKVEEWITNAQQTQADIKARSDQLALDAYSLLNNINAINENPGLTFEEKRHQIEALISKANPAIARAVDVILSAAAAEILGNNNMEHYHHHHHHHNHHHYHHGYYFNYPIYYTYPYYYHYDEHHGFHGLHKFYDKSPVANTEDGKDKALPSPPR